jgi:DGQHR domain-containing protein
MPVILCLRDYIRSGNNSYPIFIGFLSAEEVLKIAEAPSFSRNTTHQEIAENILRPPIRDWQRPLDEDRVNGISRLFNNSGEFMPNPVLLCQNGISQSNIEIRQQNTTEGGVPTNIWEITIPIPKEGEAIPLWILDGQHRISGLGKSPQSKNPIPVVLLLEQGTNVYNGPIVAKIFAQVTTSATKLDDLHNEWLTFAFKLQSYADGANRSKQDRNAMQCVANLCKNPEIGENQGVQVTNPFFNNIKFNKENSVRLTSGGFVYTCTELKELISKYYYNSSLNTGEYLPPGILSDQIALSYHALTKVVKAPQDKSVFFGQLGHSGQKIMQDAYIIGILSYLLHHPAPNSWEEILRKLSFHNTIWNFNWVRSLNGKHQTVSRKLAFNVFARAFRETVLPTTSGDLANYLQGNNACVDFEFSYLESNKILRRDKDTCRVSRGDVLSRNINGRKHIKILSKTENIGELTVSDKNSPPGRVVYYKNISKAGVILTTEEHRKPLELLVTMENYGGVESCAELTVVWDSHDS